MRRGTCPCPAPGNPQGTKFFRREEYREGAPARDSKKAMALRQVRAAAGRERAARADRRRGADARCPPRQIKVAPRGSAKRDALMLAARMRANQSRSPRRSAARGADTCCPPRQIKVAAPRIGGAARLFDKRAEHCVHAFAARPSEAERDAPALFSRSFFPPRYILRIPGANCDHPAGEPARKKE